MKSMTFNGCWRSNITVTPSNWRTLKASIRRPWRISYRFYDPAFKDDPHRWGQQSLIKGMNDFHTLAERQEMTEFLLKQETNKLDKQGYNPITGKYMAPLETPAATVTERLTSQTPLANALTMAAPLVDAVPQTKGGIAGVVKFFLQSAAMLQVDQLPVSQVNRGLIMDILDNCKNIQYPSPKKADKGKLIQKVWNDNQHNYFRKYLQIVYGVLKTKEVLEYNPVDDIPVKENLKEDEAPVATLTDEQRKVVVQALRERPAFYRFVEIFFQSGGRVRELLRVQVKHVNLNTGRYRVLIKKRKKKKWVSKTITDYALPLWAQLIDGADLNDYIFAKGLRPGVKPIRPEQTTRRWNMHIKKKLGIDVDLYKLKHLFSTLTKSEVMRQEEIEKRATAAVAAHNSHTTGKMVDQVYDTEKDHRSHEFRKKLGRPL